MLRKCLIFVACLLLGAWTHGNSGIAPTAVLFAIDGENTPQGFSPTNPSGFYDATGNKTWVSWASSYGGSPTGGSRERISVIVYDHTAGSWGSEVIAFANPNTDQHGYPGMVMDQYGFVHIFYGAHNSALHYSYTTTARSTAGFTTGTAPTGSNYTFPAPVLVGGVIWLLASDNSAGDGQNPYIVSGTPANTGGVPSWSTKLEIISEGTNSAFTFISNPVVNGTKICFAWTYSPASAAYHFDTYYGCYDTANGSFSTIDGSTSIPAGSLPISLATAQASFRIDTTASPGTNSNMQPYVLVDNGGTTHVFLASGAITGGNYTTTGTLYERHWTGSVWTAAVDTGGRLQSWQQCVAAMATSDGGFDLYWGATTNTAVQTLHWTSGGGFGSITTINPVGANPNYSFDFVGGVFNGLSGASILLPQTAFVADGSSVVGDVPYFLYGTIAAPAALPYTWNPNYKTPGMTLSNGNNTGQGNGELSNGSWVYAYHYAPVGSKVYWEATADALAASTGSFGLGFALAAEVFNNYLGKGSISVGYFANGQVLRSNALVTTIAAYTTGNNVGIAIDYANAKVWFRVQGGNWNNDVIANQNPATNTGGISIAALTANSNPIFPAFNGGTTAQQASAKFSSASWTYTPPSGFTQLP